MRGLPWTQVEDEVLRTHYPRGRRGRRRARALLGHRTEAALRRRVYQMALVRPQRQWTPDEDRLLAIEWGEIAPSTLRAKLPGRTWRAIMKRAAQTGLGHPQREMISLEEASRRSGYCAPTLCEILTRYGVEMVPLRSGKRADLRGAGARRYARWRLDPIEVEDAVRQHLEARAATPGETLSAAADRLGLLPVTLRARLRRAGLLRDLPRAEWHGRPVLLPAGLADRVAGPLTPGARHEERAA